MAQIPNNLNQQQIQQAQIQAITDLLQAPNRLGAQKTLINVNGANSKIKTNKNGQIKYTLEQPMKLEIGDRITLVQTFIEERGLSQGTITFEDDLEEQMRFLYYTQGDLRNTQNEAGQQPNVGLGADVQFNAVPAYTPDIFDSTDLRTQAFFAVDKDVNSPVNEYAFTCLNPTSNYLDTSQGPNDSSGQVNSVLFGPQGSGKDKVNGFTKKLGSGANGQYYYLMEWFNPYTTNTAGSFVLKDGDKTPYEFDQTHKAFPRPLYGQATIKIPAGNYSVSALSDLINQQLDGSGGSGDQFNRNPMLNKLYYNDNSGGFVDTMPIFNDLFDKSENTILDPAISNPDSLVIGPDTYQPYQRRRGNILTKLYMNTGLPQNICNFRCMRSRATNDAVHKYANQNIAIGSFEPGQDLGATNVLITDDRTLQTEDSPERIQFKQFQSNFYLSLAGLRALFTNDHYYDMGEPDITKYDPKFFPSLADFFLGNVGDKGLYYTGQNTANENYQPNLPSKIYRYADGDVESIYRFSFLFPVLYASGGKDGKTPTTGGGNAVQQQFAGTSSFQLSYDEGNTNRFSIENLHEPYKLANISPDGKTATNFGGQQATLVNNPILYNYEYSHLDDTISGSSRVPFFCAGVYPVEAVSGCAVNNFAFKTCESTAIYKDLVQKIADNNIDNAQNQMKREKLIFDLFTRPFDQFYSSASEAEEAWQTTLWARIGYSYKQFGDISNNLETIFTPTNPRFRVEDPGGLDEKKVGEQILEPNTAKQMGIISHNQFNFSFIPSTDGLGIGNPYATPASTSAVGTPQGYGLRGYNTAIDSAVSGVNGDYNVEGVKQNYVHILADSQKLLADEFPSLNGGNNYLVIESDIVKQNAKDSNSTPTTIVGIVSTENAQNDTIFSQSDYSFVVTEPRLLSTIEIFIKNPNGELVSDQIIGKNNGFVFSIEKAFRPAEMPLQSI